MSMSPRELAVSDIRVFGNAGGAPPETPTKLHRAPGRERSAQRVHTPGKTCPARWAYNILWGVRDEKLYQTYRCLPISGAALELRALTLNQSYSFAIEAFTRVACQKPGPVLRIP